QSDEASECAVIELADATVFVVVAELRRVPSRGGVESPTAASKPVTNPGEEEDGRFRIAIAAVVRGRIDLADPVRVPPPSLRDVQAGVDVELVRNLNRSSAGEVHAAAGAIAGQPVRRAARADAVRP